MAKLDPFLSLDCARVEGVGRNPRKGRDPILPSGNLAENMGEGRRQRNRGEEKRGVKYANEKEQEDNDDVFQKMESRGRHVFKGRGAELHVRGGKKKV